MAKIVYVYDAADFIMAAPFQENGWVLVDRRKDKTGFYPRVKPADLPDADPRPANPGQLPEEEVNRRLRKNYKDGKIALRDYHVGVWQERARGENKHLPVEQCFLVAFHRHERCRRHPEEQEKYLELLELVAEHNAYVAERRGKK